MKRITATSDQSFPTKATNWVVHSTFDKTFNLTNLKQPEMLALMATGEKIVPGGIYLSQKDFREIQHALPKVESIKSTENQLLIETVGADWEITISPKEQTILSVKGIKSGQAEKLLAAAQNISAVTGFSYPLASFCEPQNNPYFQMMQEFNQGNELQKVVDYLIGRGRGLTPAGDDFLLGWLFVEGLDDQSTTLAKAIYNRVTNNQFTTDVSRNFLTRAINGEFSQPLLAVADFLTETENTYDLAELIQAVVDYGSTSGLDTLAGILSGLLLIRGVK